MAEELDFFDKLEGITLDKEGNKVIPTESKIVLDDETDEEKEARLAKEEADKIAAEEEAEKIRLQELRDAKDKTENNDDNPSTTVYGTLATLIKEDTGLFTNFDKPIEKPEDLIEGIRFEVLEGIEDYKKSLPEDFQQMLEKYNLGLDWDTVKELKSNEVKLNSITKEIIEENENVAKDIFIAHLRATTNWSEAKIEKEYTKALDLDEVIERASEGLEELKKINAEDEKRLQAKLVEDKKQEEENLKNTLKELKDSIYDNTEIIPGIKLSEKDKAELYSQITKPVGFTKEGYAVSKVQQIRDKDPIKFETTLNYLLMKGAFDEKPNFDFIVKPVKTNTVKNLEKLAQEEAERRATGKGPKQTSSLSESILNAI
jgi:hypothetical protein